MRDNLLPVPSVNDIESVSLKSHKIACTHRHIFYVVNRIEQRNSKKKKNELKKSIKDTLKYIQGKENIKNKQFLNFESIGSIMFSIHFEGEFVGANQPICVFREILTLCL